MRLRRILDLLFAIRERGVDIRAPPIALAT